MGFANDTLVGFEFAFYPILKFTIPLGQWPSDDKHAARRIRREALNK